MFENDIFFSENINEEFGIKTNIQKLENGELRARLIGNDKSSYIRTESGDNEYWQRAHYHNYLNEMYIVQSGKIIIAVKKDDDVEFITLNKDDYFVLPSKTSHNVYMFKNTVTHTVKFGDIIESDWNLDEPFNNITQNIEIDLM